jgi:hypothetical protein
MERGGDVPCRGANWVSTLVRFGHAQAAADVAVSVKPNTPHAVPLRKRVGEDIKAFQICTSNAELARWSDTQLA